MCAAPDVRVGLAWALRGRMRPYWQALQALVQVSCVSNRFCAVPLPAP
jgi:hypothetical protein